MAIRRALDKYYSPEIFIPPLIENISIEEGATIFEPCVGNGSLIEGIKKCGVKARFITNDIDPNTTAVLHRDASKYQLWEAIRNSKQIGLPDWTITNPPFNKAVEILEYARLYSKVGVALYLRLSFQEPCADREDLLYDFPPTKQITLGRWSFTENGKADLVTGAWFVWEKNATTQFMRSYSKDRCKDMWEALNT